MSRREGPLPEFEPASQLATPVMTSSAPPPKPPLEPGEVAPPPKPGLLRWLTRAIGPAILIAIIASIDRDELFRVISRAAIVPLLTEQAKCKLIFRRGS